MPFWTWLHWSFTGKYPKQSAPAEVLEPIIPGQRWQFTPRDESPWPSRPGVVVIILDVHDGWVRYDMGSVFPDNRQPERLFREMYRPALRR